MKEKSYSVYMHINKVNNKKYIGATSIKPYRRWNNGNGYKGQPFFNAIEKYGWDSFEHIIIANGLIKDDALKLEHELVEKYKTTNSEYGYNIVKGGHGSGIMDNITKSKISNSMKKSYANGDRIPPMLGKCHTDETKKKIALINYKNGKYSTYIA